MYMSNPFDSAIKKIESAAETTNQTIEPIRQSAFKRFPVLFAFLVTFGFSTISFGIERILGDTHFLNDRPFLILALGVFILALTGRLYKKLG